MLSRFRTRQPFAIASLALALALALWLAQTLALAHQIAREPGHAHSGALFAHHDDDPAQCRLLDQQTHAAPAGADLPVTSVAYGDAAPASLAASQRHAAPAAAYSARAPPPGT